MKLEDLHAASKTAANLQQLKAIAGVFARTPHPYDLEVTLHVRSGKTYLGGASVSVDVADEFVSRHIRRLEEQLETLGVKIKS